MRGARPRVDRAGVASTGTGRRSSGRASRDPRVRRAAASAPCRRASPTSPLRFGGVGSARRGRREGSGWDALRDAARAARRRGASDGDGIDAGDRGGGRCGDRPDSTSSPGPPEPPARVHGDLWSGNVHAGADGRPWLIDPAAHGAHRELDLAMLRLFGTISRADARRLRGGRCRSPPATTSACRSGRSSRCSSTRSSSAVPTARRSAGRPRLYALSRRSPIRSPRDERGAAAPGDRRASTSRSTLFGGSSDSGSVLSPPRRRRRLGLARRRPSARCSTRSTATAPEALAAADRRARGRLRGRRRPRLDGLGARRRPPRAPSCSPSAATCSTARRGRWASSSTDLRPPPSRCRRRRARRRRRCATIGAINDAAYGIDGSGLGGRRSSASPTSPRDQPMMALARRRARRLRDGPRPRRRRLRDGRRDACPSIAGRASPAAIIVRAPRRRASAGRCARGSLQASQAGRPGLRAARVRRRRLRRDVGARARP